MTQAYYRKTPQQALEAQNASAEGLSAQEARRRAEQYRPQLEAYSRALERITGRRVAHRILWFFATGTGLEL